MEKLATMGGIGHLRFAPGTAGSAAAAVLGYGLLQLPFGWGAMPAAVLGLTVLGAMAANRYMAAHGHLHDPSAIVVDEWAGQWLTYSIWHLWLLAVAGTADAGAALLTEIGGSPLHLFYGFVLFRFFDIMKPWPIRWADRKIMGGFGVMFDDLLAGIFAGTLLFAIYFLAPLLSGNMMDTPV